MADSEHDFTCTNCDEVTHEVIQCAICTDFRLCRECFEGGAEIGPHKKTHDFKIMDTLYTGPIFPGLNNWHAQEELELIEKIIRYGFCQWDKIAEAFAPKTPEEVKEHFCQMFIEGNIGKATFGTCSPFDIKDFSGQSCNQTSTPTDEINPNREIYTTIQYKPFRDEYFQEFDDDAEEDLLICLSDKDVADDEELNIPLKKACIDIYISRVRTRFKRHAFIKEYDLIKEFENAENTRSQSAKDKILKDESLLKNQMRIFNRLMPESEMETFVKNLIKEKKLKARIRELTAKLPKPIKSPKSPNAKADSTKLNPYKTLKENKHKKMSSPVTLDSPRKDGKYPIQDVPCLKRKAEYKDESDSYELLTKAEKRLCSVLDLEPTCYMALKLVLLKEKNMNTEAVKHIVPPAGMNKSGLQKVNNYLYSSGWIPNS